MTDYYPLVARAVAGLSSNTGEVRRTLYDRARTALVTQLRSSDPPLSESDITHERLALEEAIRRVEFNAAHRPQDFLAETASQELPPVPYEEPRQPEENPERPPEDFRDTLGEAAELGNASSQAARDARDTYGSIPGDSEPPPPRPAPPERDRVIGAGAPPPFEDADESYRGSMRSYGVIIKVVLVLLVLAGIAGGVWWKHDNILALFSPSRQATQTARDNSAAAGKPKIADRIAPGAQDQRAGAAPASDVAQKVVLYEEDTNDPQGKRSVGSVLWRTETVSPGPGLAPELAVRGDVDIPERRIKMTMSLRRNADKALPASHTIELLFTVPADFSEGGIANVPGVLMKSGEQTRGTPLSGLAVKVTAGYFLIGLSSADSDMQRNLQLLKERPWFDIPVVYNNGKRAIIAVEKGPGGERVFEDALRAWGQ
jgi:hypothetical protein